MSCMNCGARVADGMSTRDEERDYCERCCSVILEDADIYSAYLCGIIDSATEGD